MTWYEFFQYLNDNGTLIDGLTWNNTHYSFQLVGIARVELYGHGKASIMFTPNSATYDYFNITIDDAYSIIQEYLKSRQEQLQTDIQDASGIITI